MLRGIERLAGQEQAYACLILAVMRHESEARFQDVVIYIVELFETLGNSPHQMRDNCHVLSFDMETHAYVLLYKNGGREARSRQKGRRRPCGADMSRDICEHSRSALLTIFVPNRDIVPAFSHDDEGKDESFRPLPE
jgi:hypothetical protein